MQNSEELSTNVNLTRRLHILVIYSAYTTRTNLLDSLYSFRNYTNHFIYYYNIRLRDIPKIICSIKFDLIIFHTLFFSNKFDRVRQLRLFEKVYQLCENQSRKVITPQDEFVNNDIVCDFINRAGINTIFTVQPKNVWTDVYKLIDEEKTKIYSVLTGYLDDKRIAEYSHFLDPLRQRNITVGYRALTKSVLWWGRHGYLKERIARVFEQKLWINKIDFDISTETKDAKAGQSWTNFMGDCKYTLGVESGTSLLDYDGSIKLATETYLLTNSHAKFEQVEAACFPNLDGKFEGYMIAPRHLEACLAGTCQILTEGFYSGILKPNIHYIPIAKDFSDINEVIKKIKSDIFRKDIVDNAYRDIVASGKYNMNIFPMTVIGDLSIYPFQSFSHLDKLIMKTLYSTLRVLDLFDRCVAIIINFIEKFFEARRFH
jgi:hypothetical protein